MRVRILAAAPRTDQLAVSSLAPYPQAQRLGNFIDFVPKDPVARPSQNFREFVVAHSAESSRTALRRKLALLLRLYEFLLRAILLRTEAWTGTTIIFEIATNGDKTQVRLVHVGLVPDYNVLARALMLGASILTAENIKELEEMLVSGVSALPDPKRKERPDKSRAHIFYSGLT